MRRLLGPGLATLAMLAVLVGLGVWQVQRLAWKRGLLAAIDQAEASPAVPLPGAPFQPTQFQKVVVRGVFRPVAPAFYGAEVRDLAGGPHMGARLIAPLDPDGGGAPVLVDRGWAPLDAPLPPPPAGATSVEGFVRTPDAPGWFSAADDPAARRFYTLDPGPIGAALGLPLVAPFTLVALGRATAPPIPARGLPRPPNDHLSYALTWFGLAGVLVVVFTVWSRKVLAR